MKVSTHNHTFLWKMATERALQKKLYRAIQLARNNPDYQLKYPQEHKQNPEGKVLSHCHKDAEIRITKEHITTLRNSQVPSVERPKRLNRNG